MPVQGAVFNLTLRDERFDKLHTAADYLRARLDKIRLERYNEGLPNVQPTFLDIEKTHTLYIHAAYRPYVAVASEYSRVKPTGDGSSGVGSAGGSIQFTFPIYGHFTSDMAIHVRFKEVGSKTATVATAITPMYRYCTYPGVKMFKRIEFKSDQVMVDDYTPEDVIFDKQFFIDTDARIGWDRCVGEQDVKEASYYGNGYTGVLQYKDGPQTPKLYQESFDMFVPLKFWFCKDAKHALLNDLIPNTQRTIVCHISPLDEILEALIPDPASPGAFIKTPIPFNSLGMDINLYVNGLYVNPEIHDIFASRVGFSLIRVHRRQINQIQSQSGNFLLDQLKFPAEYFMFGFRARSLKNDFERWHLMGKKLDRTLAPGTKLYVPSVIWNPGPPAAIPQLVVREAVEFSTLKSIVDTIGLTAHGIEIFPNIPGPFYNAYLPSKYNQNSMICSPTDTSIFLISFCLYPGKFNPSGYFNLSAGREMYLNYSLRADAAEGMIGGEYEMILSMSALNFLVRKGDKVSLRYSL